MTPKQRYLETMLFGNPDKIPLHVFGARESTLVEWKKQGLQEGVEYSTNVLDLLGIKREAAYKRNSINVSFKLIPEFEPKIFEHRDGRYVIRDWMGAITEVSDRYDESYLRYPKDFVTRKWHKFPVENREDWDEMKKRYDASNPERFQLNFIEQCKNIKTSEYPSVLHFNGVFWQLREWCGFENLCIMMVDEPCFIHDMASFWSYFVTDMLERIFRYIIPDCIVIAEDMAYKAHSMISPMMIREYILPVYNQWIPYIKRNGCQIIELDSDGCIEELIPIWIEAGINCTSPVEVAALCDIVKYREKYGRQLAYAQGIDKRIIAMGGKELENHIKYIVPHLFKDGGYIPGCDHGIPPDISWGNYIQCTRLLAQLSGWL